MKSNDEVKQAIRPPRRRRSRKRNTKNRCAPKRNPKAGAVKQKPDLQVELRAGAKRSSVAHLTIQAKRSKMGQFARYVAETFPLVVTMRMVDIVVVQAYMDMRKEDGISDRTRQNDMAAIRTTFRDAGFIELANAPELSCKAFGIDGASRAGTKTAASKAEFDALIIAAQKISPALAACLWLQWAIGLRAMEAIRCGPSLLSWKQQLRLGQPLKVIDGTKGGRKRFVNVVDVEDTAAAIEEALRVVAVNGGVLIPGSLKQAYSFYRHKMNEKLRFQGHSLRYAFTFRRVLAYLDIGLTLDEALARTAEDLGHGKGRASWVRWVYLNGVDPALLGASNDSISKTEERAMPEDGR